MSLPIREHAWGHVTMDLYCGVTLPKTKDGDIAILVAVDELTKMTHFEPCRNQSGAHEIA